MKWDLINRNGGMFTYRASVPGGWLVLITDERTSAVTFVPDKEHGWSIA